MLDKWKAMNEELRPIAMEHGAIFQVIARDGDNVVTVNLWRSAEASEAMEDWLIRDHHGKAPRQRCALADFGMSEALIEESFGSYIDHYGVSRERG